MKKVFFITAAAVLIAIGAWKVGTFWEPGRSYAETSGEMGISEVLEEPSSQSRSEPVESTENGANTAETIAEAWEPDGYLAQRAGYHSLPENLQKLYEELLVCASTMKNVAENNGLYPIREAEHGSELTDDEILQTVSALRNDNPQMFWISNQYSYTVTPGKTSVQLFSWIAPEEAEQMREELWTAVGNILDEMNQEADVFNQELYLYRSLAESCEFDNAAAENTAYWKAYTAYGAICGGDAVCEGYSRGMQLLLSCVGIPCRLVDGTAGGDRHMWNLVLLDGEWYHLDAAWSDYEVAPGYEYFNVTDEKILQDHIISTTGLPKCTSADMNCFAREGIPVQGLDESRLPELASAIAEKVSAGENPLCFRIAVGQSYEETVDALLTEEPYLLFRAAELANRTLETPISTQEMTYTLSPLERGVTVWIG